VKVEVLLSTKGSENNDVYHNAGNPFKIGWLCHGKNSFSDNVNKDVQTNHFSL